MATMIPEVYDALRDAQGVSEDKARKAAEAVAAYENRFARLEAETNLLKWMVGANLTLTMLLVGGAFALWSKLGELAGQLSIVARAAAG